MPMTTNALLIRRAFGTAWPEHYVHWALDRLCNDDDTHSLRILAGLNPKHEAYEIEGYFLKACSELDIHPISLNSSPRQIAQLIWQSHVEGNISSAELIHSMANLYQRSDYRDILFSFWFNISEEIDMTGSGHGGIFYPPDLLADLDSTVRREWLLFERGQRLDFPSDFGSYVLCNGCGHIGKVKHRYKTIRDRVRALLPWIRPKPPLWPYCSECGITDYRGMCDPVAREEYYQRLSDDTISGAHAH